MDPVVHFEMPFEDRERMTAFYAKAFGWKMQKYGEDMGNYVVAQTTETDDMGMIQSVGHINGGFFEKSSENAHPSVVISVDDLDAAIKKVKEVGGVIQGEPTDIPEVGRYVGFVDTEGNRNSLLQALPRSK